MSDSVDVVHVNLDDGDVGPLSDTESNRTVPADGWDDDPAEEDDRMVEYTFIQNRFHPLTLSSKHDFIQF